MINRKLTAVVFAILLLVTSQVMAAQLRWKVADGQQIHYKTAAEIDITGKFDTLDHAALMSNNEKFNAFIQQLRTLEMAPGYLHYRTTINNTDRADIKNVLRVNMVGLPIKLSVAPGDALMQELQYKIDALKNAIMMQGDMDTSGDSRTLTFYRTENERNILTHFFYLPKKPVAPGDHWRLPVRLQTFGPGFFPTRTATHNRVEITAIEATNAGVIAQITYRVMEQAKGYAERVRHTDKGQQPFTLSTAVLGYGEFNIDKGRWVSQRIVYSYQGTGIANMNKQRLFSLQFTE